VINSRFLVSLIIGLLVLGGIFWGASQWELSSLLSMTSPSKSTPEKQVTANKPVQSMPEEFVNIDGKAVGYDEQDAINQQYAAMTTPTLWQSLLDSLKEGGQNQMGLESALIARLRKEPGNSVYADLLSRFKRGGLNTTSQQVLTSILGEVGNYKAAETLMRLVGDGLLQIPDVRLSAFQAISKFSPESWHDHANTELAPVFEAAWQTQDTEFLSAIANVMASIGTPATLDIFIKTLTDNSDEGRVEIVQQAITNVVNPALIPKLGDFLRTSTVENVQFASGSTLANMGQLDAAEELFQWSTQAEANRVELVREWLGHAMNTTPEFVDYLATHLAEQKFAAPEIKAVIVEVLDNIKNGVE
jgi:hypothetical protein